jgi:glycosyltransferase involved in cell wall biosynthesis
VVDLSIVVPVYNCEGCLRALHERLTDALDRLDVTYELVLVDDRSGDSSWIVLEEIAARDNRVLALRLSRNFGQHAAITAGLEASSGRWSVVMDCDLQDPPELVPALYERALEGHEIVLARRLRSNQNAFRRLGARLYFRLLNLFLDTQIDGEYGTFSILSEKVRHAFLEVKDKDRHYLHIVFWLGFDHGTFEYEPADRLAGRSSYTWGKLVRHALDGVFFQTTTLLRWIVYLGFATALGGVLLAIAFIVVALVANPPPGWTSLAVLILLVGGFIIVSTGVTGLYIGRIFRQVKDRPLYIVDRVAEPHKSTDEQELAAAGDRVDS